MREHLLDQHAFLTFVDCFHTLRDPGLKADRRARADDSFDILGKAGTAVAGARAEVVATDPGIAADAPAHRLDVGAQPLGQARQFIHQADPGRQHDVGGVLGEFGGAHVHVQDLVAVAIKWRKKPFQHLSGVHALAADNDAIRLHEVADGGAFPLELGVRGDVEVDVGIPRCQHFADLLPHLVRRTHRHRRLVDDDFRRFQKTADVLRHREHMAQIRRAGRVRRRAHRDEEHFAVADAQLRIRRETKPPATCIAVDHPFEIRLEHRHPARPQGRDLVRVDIHAQDGVAHLREAGARDQAYVSGPEHRDIQDSIPPLRAHPSMDKLARLSHEQEGKPCLLY